MLRESDLRKRYLRVGIPVILLGLVVLTGSQDETTIAREVSQLMQFRCATLAGQTSLGGVAALLSESRLLICNDTGVSHIAAALEVPSVVVVTGSDPERWAPKNQQLHRAIFEPITCRPCAHFLCPIGHPCARSVSVKRVLNEARLLLAQSPRQWEQAARDLAAMAARQRAPL